MSNPNMENKVKELLELKRMKEELEAEISTMEDEIKQVMGEEETLLAGAFKVSWKTFTSSRFDSVRFKKEHAELAAAYTKQTTARRFSIN
jgi:predicted phage-related endonuclease